MITLRGNGLIDENQLDEKELRAFIVFLQQERDRHIDDIQKIDDTLKKIVLRGGKKQESPRGSNQPKTSYMMRLLFPLTSYGDTPSTEEETWLV